MITPEFAYLCYQSAEEYTLVEGYTTNVLAICDNEEKAQEICCNNGDCYTIMVLNLDYGREIIDSSDDTIYNVEGIFMPYIEVKKFYNYKGE